MGFDRRIIYESHGMRSSEVKESEGEGRGVVGEEVGEEGGEEEEREATAWEISERESLIQLFFLYFFFVEKMRNKKLEDVEFIIVIE